MKMLLHSPVGQAVVVAVVLVVGFIAVRLQHRTPPPLPSAPLGLPTLLPQVFSRDGARFPKVSPPAVATAVTSTAATTAPKPIASLPLTIFAEKAPAPEKISAPYGRLIPCELVVALESNRLETPVIGLVTEDVWHDGKIIVPAGAEVHGRAALDRTRERLAATGAWHIVWRTPDENNGTTVTVEGLALDREFDGEVRTWGEHDGSAGLRGEVITTGSERELKLFAATFLATATSALQDTRNVATPFSEANVPAATARNATLAGTAAILREYAQELREAIAKDGFYLRVPAGKQFYLYVTQTLERGVGPHSSQSEHEK